MKKLFDIQKNRFHYTVTVFGIKFKLKSLKLTNEYIMFGDKNHPKLSLERLWLLSNKDKITTEQKIWYLTEIFYVCCGYFPNFKTPKSFNEKLNWMKLNYYDPTTYCINDKSKFKDYIKEKLGDGYTIPLLGVYDEVNDIDFDSLPNQFVIKTTCSGGANGVHIVKDKKSLNIDALKYKFNNLIQEWNTCYYSCLDREYRDIKQKIIIEEYLEEKGGLTDYKFYCFHGEPKIILGMAERNNGKYKLAFMTPEWEKIKLRWEKHKPVANLEKPKNYEKMLEISKKLSKPFPFVRVDFYEVNGKLYIGELTFTSKSGFAYYQPRDWDYKLGEWLDLEQLNPKYVEIAEGFEDTELGQYYLNKKH